METELSFVERCFFAGLCLFIIGGEAIYYIDNILAYILVAWLTLVGYSYFLSFYWSRKIEKSTQFFNAKKEPVDPTVNMGD